MIPEPGTLLDALVDASVRGTFIVAAVAIVLALARIRAGAVRHLAWTSVVLAMLATPFVPKWLPAVPMALPQTADVVGLMAHAPLASAAGPAADSVSRMTPSRSGPALAPATSVAPGPQVAAERAAGSRIAVDTWLLAIWFAGFAVAVVHLAAGWLQARGLASTSRPAGAEGDVFESPVVASPVVTGVLSPRIVLPAEASGWSPEMRQVVLLHERAHIRRRDTVVALIAAVNRCVHWFNPLAWWLERRVAAAAEHACDDEVMRAGGDARRYAATLLDVAATVRRRGARVSWQAIGMTGGSSLERRIDRLVDGRWATSSRRSAVAAIALTAAVILPGVGCQQPPSPLREDPEIARRLEAQRIGRETYESAKAMTLGQVEALEIAMEKDPDDLEAARRLLIFYRESGQKLMGWNEMVAARRKLLLRVIERHPESELVWWPLPKRLDPEGWAAARALWLAHLERPDVTPRVLGAAAGFFGISEKPMAEEILLRAAKVDPGGPVPRVVDNVYYSPWISRLGALYARAIVGSDDDTLGNVVRSVSLEEANGRFAARAKEILETTTDAALLRAAGTYLTQNARGQRDGTVGDQQLTLPFDHRALGESYLDRSIALDPDSETTRRFVAYRERAKRQEAEFEQLRALLGDRWADASPEQVNALSEIERLTVLPALATRAYMRAESVENSTKDAAEFTRQLERSGTFADQALALAARVAEGPRRSRALHAAHLARGVVALRQGDRRLAVEHLSSAADSATDAAAIEGEPVTLRQRLANYLLKDGERESVAAFFEKLSRVTGPSQQEFADAARAIREGRMPQGYQYAMTPR